MMDVAENTQQVLREHNINFEILDTKKAVQRLNELSKEDVDYAAALHLTC